MGPVFPQDLISSSPIDLATRIARQMPSPDSTIWNLNLVLQKPLTPNLLCRSWGKGICPIYLSPVPHGLRLWTARQPANPLAPSQSLLVAHDDPGYLPIRQAMIRLCHHQHSMGTPRGEAGTVTNSSTSHMGIDFITDLPPSDSHTCVFIIVDCFSNARKLIPLKGLPTAFKAAEILFQHVFRHTYLIAVPNSSLAQNSLRQTTTGLTPFQCILGYQPPLFPWSGKPSEVPTVNHWFKRSERMWTQRMCISNRQCEHTRGRLTPAYLLR